MGGVGLFILMVLLESSCHLVYESGYTRWLIDTWRSAKINLNTDSFTCLALKFSDTAYVHGGAGLLIVECIFLMYHLIMRAYRSGTQTRAMFFSVYTWAPIAKGWLPILLVFIHLSNAASSMYTSSTLMLASLSLHPAAASLQILTWLWYMRTPFAWFVGKSQLSQIGYSCQYFASCTTCQWTIPMCFKELSNF